MKKLTRIIAIILVVLLVAISIPPVMPSVSAATLHTQNEAVEWAQNAIGTKYDYDNAYGAQCVDLLKYYYIYLGCSAIRGNAIEYTYNALPNGWQRIQYYTGFVPQPGDIAVWSGGAENSGHVAIVLWATSSGITVVEQNHDGSGKRPASQYTYSYGKAGSITFWGVIRPDFNSTPTPPVSYTTMEAGNYFFKNKAHGTYMCVSYGTDQDGQNVDVYQFVDSPALQWNMTASSTAEYEMTPHCSWTRLLNVYADSVSAGKNVTIYRRVNDGTQRWKFEKVSGGFIIHNAQNPSCVLDVYDAYNVCVSTKTGNNTQIWEVQSRIYYDANGGTGAPGAAWKTYGSALTLSSTKPTKSGYTFLGWSTDQNATSASYAAGSTYSAEGTKTLYAVYRKNEAHTSCTFGSWTTTKAATCTNTGTQTRTCSVCKKTETKTISALGHRLGAWTVSKAATCTTNGQQKQACTRSDCTYALTKPIAATGHQFAEPTVTKQPTCTQPGVESGKCKHCNATTSQNIPALGHHYSEPAVIAEPTLSTPEIIGGTCDRCQDVSEQRLSCRYEDSESGLIITADEGVFAAGTTVNILRLDGGEEGEENKANFRERLETEDTVLQIYLLRFAVNGKVVTPKGTYTVTLPAVSGVSAEKLTLYHVTMDNSTSKPHVTHNENGTLSFEADTEGMYYCVLTAPASEDATAQPDSDNNKDEHKSTSKTTSQEKPEFPLWALLAILGGVVAIVSIIVIVVLIHKRK